MTMVLSFVLLSLGHAALKPGGKCESAASTRRSLKSVRSVEIRFNRLPMIVMPGENPAGLRWTTTGERQLTQIRQALAVFQRSAETLSPPIRLVGRFRGEGSERLFVIERVVSVEASPDAP